mmetsp:Transcript_35091/g.56344  ORF Transcript_35091/g.56344 Transcript_35091/m.56344 type:complete len:238 (+) Transcript_35091:92-805(+)
MSTCHSGHGYLLVSVKIILFLMELVPSLYIVGVVASLVDLFGDIKDGVDHLSKGQIAGVRAACIALIVFSVCNLFYSVILCVAKVKNDTKWILVAGILSGAGVDFPLVISTLYIGSKLHETDLAATFAIIVNLLAFVIKFVECVQARREFRKELAEEMVAQHSFVYRRLMTPDQIESIVSLINSYLCVYFLEIVTVCIYAAIVGLQDGQFFLFLLTMYVSFGFAAFSLFTGLCCEFC